MEERKIILKKNTDKKFKTENIGERLRKIKVNLTENILDIICPKTCPMCDKILSSHENICTACHSKLVYIHEPKCKKCGKELQDETKEYCTDCSVNKHFFKCNVAVFEYSHMVSRSLYKFKYHNRRTYAKFYGEAMAKHCAYDIEMWNTDVIIPVPIHYKKRIKRGYNQAALIARELGKRTNILVDEKYLYRVVNTKPMKELNKTTRKKNVEKAFKIYKNVVKYNKIILVDDIYTTGSTLDACAKALLAAGVKEIYCICMSVGYGI